METTNRSSWGGMAAIGTGVLWILWTLAPWTLLLVPALLLTFPAMYALYARRQRGSSWLSGVGCALAITGSGSGALAVALIMRGNTATLAIAAMIGLVALAGGMVLLGIAAFNAGAPTRLVWTPLIIGVGTAAYAGWFWFFILDRPYPPAVPLTVWIILGIVVGLAWGNLGLWLLGHARQVASSQPH